jgi:cleavage and polyadenylation specificity factor subunit 1
MCWIFTDLANNVCCAGYTEPVVVVLHEKEPTWAGRVAVRRHTCAITALSINTTLKQHPLIWSATNLPYDAYKLLAVPSPIGGVLVLCANTIHYYSQSTSCALALNEFAVAPEGSPDFPKSKITVELDTAHAAWVSHDVALLSTKTGNLLLLSLVYDGRCGGNPSYPVLFVTYVHCFFDQKQD